MYQDILFPTDGSDGAEYALDHAIDLAGRYDATLHVLHVVADVWYPTGEPEGVDFDYTAVEQHLQDRGDRVVAAAADRAREAGVDCETEVTVGRTPHSAIADATEADVDLVVMATHGRRGLGRLLMGSVTEKVLRLSTVPVLAVRMPEE
ncbi:universal stress protein [Halomarina oriensis]|uniref:Universal stress protein n=1 Tax=Halomarina oriensis TaxID=671145 RepID=A0A6B0GTN2_9EURY|nr:universal stress protein [Halomarina oriensis]MWG35078.1 universal stress protein [Halomarina oriensis]